jgi:hypothetical protein
MRTPYRVALWLAVALPNTVFAADSTAKAAYAKLKTLTGAWQAKSAKGATIRVSFRAVSADSALVETYITASGKETLTIFHLDGDRLLSTHYCAQGNQPRLALDRSSTADHLVFNFVDATNLAARAESHLVQLDFVFKSAAKFSMTETYEEAGKPDVTTLEFQRAQ